MKKRLIHMIWELAEGMEEKQRDKFASIISKVFSFGLAEHATRTGQDTKKISAGDHLDMVFARVMLSSGDLLVKPGNFEGLLGNRTWERLVDVFDKVDEEMENAK